MSRTIKKNLAILILIKHLIHYRISNNKYYDDIELTILDYQTIEGFLKGSDTPIGYPDTWKGWFGKKILNDAPMDVTIKTWIELINPLFPNINQFITYKNISEYYKDDPIVSEYETLTHKRNKKKSEFQYSDEDLKRIKQWVKNLIVNDGYFKQNSHDFEINKQNISDVNKEFSTIESRSIMEGGHPCDQYINHFYIDTGSKAYIEDSRTYLKNYFRNFSNYIHSNELVGRLKGIDGDGRKFIDLFDYQIDDIKLIYNREEDIYKRYINDIVTYGSQNPFILIGEAGGGKTSLCYMMFQEIVKTYFLSKRETNKLIPLYLPIYMFKEIDDLSNPAFFSKLYKDLDKEGIKESVLQMIEQGKVILILDGLDEIDIKLFEGFNTSYGNDNITDDKLLFLIQELISTYKKCPVIITCRRHFCENYWDNVLKKIGFEILHIKPLSGTQIDNYIQNRINEDTEKALNTSRFIEHTGLAKLAPTVVLLEMIVTNIINDKEDNILTHLTMTKTNIYKTLVRDWCEEQAIRVQKIVNNSDFNNIKKADLTNRYLMIVSLAMFYYGQDGILIISSEKIMSYFKLYKVDKEKLQVHATDLKNIFSHLSFSQTDENYTFNHKTILEYLVSEAVLLGLKNDFKIITNDTERAVFVMLSKPLDKQDDNEIIGFIKEHANELPEEEKHNITYRLMDIIHENFEKKNLDDFTTEERKVIRNNALKILAHINNMDLSVNEGDIPVQFTINNAKYNQYKYLMKSKDFSNLQLPSCNFTDRDLSYSNLSESLLRGSNFSGCNLFNTSFSNANLTGAYLGDSHSLWEMKFFKGALVVDCGKGELILTKPKKQLRDKSKSAKDLAIWTIEIATINNTNYAITGQHSHHLSIYELAGEMDKTSIKINFPIKVFTIKYHPLKDILFYGGSTGNIHYISNFSILIAQKNLDNYLEKPDNCLLHNLNFNPTDSHIKKDHKDNIFGIVFSSCQKFLISCSGDKTIKSWEVENLIKEVRHENDDIRSEKDIPETFIESSVRKIATVNYKSDDYFVAGTEKGSVLVCKNSNEKLTPLFAINNIQYDWILDIEFFEYESETYFATVSGDFTVCIWKFSNVLEERKDSEPVFMAKYSSSLLSVTSDGGTESSSKNVFFGSYDGNIIAKEIGYLLRSSPNRDEGDKIIPELWTRSDALIESDGYPESFVSDANNLNIHNVSGLNKGRLLALEQSGALDFAENELSQAKSGVVRIKEQLNNLNWKIRVDAVKGLASRGRVTKNLRPFIIKSNEFITEFYSAKDKIDALLLICDDKGNKQDVIELFQMLTSVKVTIASGLMVIYWLDEETWREERKLKINIDLHTQLIKRIDNKKIKHLQESKSRVIFERVVEEFRDVLETFFTNNNPDNIFRFTYEDYQNNRKLRALCDFLGGNETNKQIPDESEALRKIGVANLWTEISNNFWTGNSRIAKSYFDSFVNKIYSCCKETHIFLINHITNYIKETLAQSKDKKITYLDLATGFNGTIILGVYNGLTDIEKTKVSFIASDSSHKIVSALKKYFQDESIDIQVVKQNLLTVERYNENSIDIISQNLGAHHLSKYHQKIMYQKFTMLLKDKGLLAVGDVSQQPIKVLAGLPDDIGAPESPYDCRKLNIDFLKPKIGGCFPDLGNDEGFYTCQIYGVQK